MTVSGYDSSSISTLLSSLSSSSSSSSSIYDINLSDYNLIKTGSYSKLMKSYYSSSSSSSSSTSSTVSDLVSSTSTSTSKDSTKTLTAIEEASDDLVDSAQTLYKSTSTVFKQTNGSYDTDKIYNAVSQFVDDYNSLLDATDDSETTNITSASKSMQLATTNVSSKLSAIGISVDSKTGELSIDESTFKSADMDKVKSLFNGNSSFAYSTAVKASGIKSYAQTESTKSATYTTSGTYTYNYVTGELYSSSI